MAYTFHELYERLCLADESVEIVRIAEPDIHPNRNVVDVHYQILVKDKITGQHESLEETHHMRYLFAPELKALLAAADLNVVGSEEWLTGKAPGFDTWGVCFVAGG